MKKSYLLTSLLVCFTSSIYCQLSGNGPSLSHTTSMSGPPVAPRESANFSNIVSINGSDGFYLRKDLYLVYYTMIDGQKVQGLPFLFADWESGTLTTPDGRLYTDYKLKYNVQNQTVCFLNGKDSLDVNEDIKEFTLKSITGDSSITSTFVNSAQYEKGKTFYYEVLLDNEKGQLLKTNNKVVANSDNGIIGSRTTKYLNLEGSYYYYDKKAKKITKIKPSTNIQSMLHLTDQDASDLHFDTFDLSSEQQLITMMKNYFEKAKLKGF